MSIFANRALGALALGMLLTLAPGVNAGPRDQPRADGEQASERGQSKAERAEKKAKARSEQPQQRQPDSRPPQAEPRIESRRSEPRATESRQAEPRRVESRPVESREPDTRRIEPRRMESRRPDIRESDTQRAEPRPVARLPQPVERPQPASALRRGLVRRGMIEPTVPPDAAVRNTPQTPQLRITDADNRTTGPRRTRTVRTIGDTAPSTPTTTPTLSPPVTSVTAPELTLQPQLRPDRASRERHIRDEGERAARYHDRRSQQSWRARDHARSLQQHHRMAQYRYQQHYLERLREQQARWNSRRYNPYNDRYFSTPASYRYTFGGRSYRTNRYGADLMRQAVNYGYQEGLRAGQADRQDGWRADYRSSYGYQDANYGYDGYYLDQDAYNHYFREGFQRGYEDGYYRRYRHGRNDDDGNYAILATVLAVILGLELLN